MRWDRAFYRVRTGETCWVSHVRRAHIIIQSKARNQKKSLGLRDQLLEAGLELGSSALRERGRTTNATAFIAA